MQEELPGVSVLLSGGLPEAGPPTPLACLASLTGHLTQPQGPGILGVQSVCALRGPI